MNRIFELEQQIRQIAEALGLMCPTCGYAFLNTTREKCYSGGHGMAGNTAQVYRVRILWWRCCKRLRHRDRRLMTGERICRRRTGGAQRKRRLADVNERGGLQSRLGLNIK